VYLGIVAFGVPLLFTCTIMAMFTVKDKLEETVKVQEDKLCGHGGCGTTGMQGVIGPLEYCTIHEGHGIRIDNSNLERKRTPK
jgi:hypothetical protein